VGVKPPPDAPFRRRRPGATETGRRSCFRRENLL
jgi:hypothetical protein